MTHDGHTRTSRLRRALAALVTVAVLLVTWAGPAAGGEEVGTTPSTVAAVDRPVPAGHTDGTASLLVGVGAVSVWLIVGSILVVRTRRLRRTGERVSPAETG
jgi:hypothetical protein